MNKDRFNPKLDYNYQNYYQETGMGQAIHIS